MGQDLDDSQQYISATDSSTTHKPIV